MELAGWLRVFRALGRRAEELARPLVGTDAARRALGRGAGGDTTVFIDRVLERPVVEAVGSVGRVRLISEEAGVRDFGEPEVSVIADPLDGSVNAKLGVPLFAASYALGPPEPTLGTIQLGYVRNLVSGDEYWATRGGGAHRNGVRIKTSRRPGLELLLMEVSPGQRRALRASRELLHRAARVRCLGSVALDLCLVASGVASAAVDLRGNRLRTLDQCAGKLILEEAGGLVTDARGRSTDELDVDLTTRTDIIAAGSRGVLERILRMKRG
ncbi:MAG: inositol monophosphatase family protein [Thermoplasmatota archaeon]